MYNTPRRRWSDKSLLIMNDLTLKDLDVFKLYSGLDKLIFQNCLAFRNLTNSF